MKQLSARDQFTTALLLLDQAREEASALPPLATLSTDAELEQRARVVHAVLRARNWFEQINQRAQRLSESLGRFQQRRLQLLAARA